MHRFRLLLLLPMLPGLAFAQAAAQRVHELDEIVVTAAAADGTLRTVPHGASLITASDIERSPAATLTELLAREANLNLQSFFGNDKRTTVDMRGMGSTATSNVLVLVDGVQLNEVDQSGADFSSIPMYSIERIEIIRGGGAVRYGDGAVGGIINIITKRAGRQGISGSVGAGAGAYGARNHNVSMSAVAGPWSLRLNAARNDSDGYRQNNYLYSRSGSAEIRFAPISALDFFFRASQVIDDYGLPGGVSRAALAAGTTSRRSASSLTDSGSTDDRSYALGMNVDFAAGGVTTLQGTLRDRSAPFGSAGSPFLIESKREGIQLSHQVDIPAFDRKHTLTVGTGAWSAEYARYQNGRDTLGSVRNSGDLNNRSGHAELLLRVTEGLTINAGMRKERYDSTRRQQQFDPICDKQLVFLPGVGLIEIDVNCRSPSYVTKEVIHNTWRNRANEIGVTWLITPAWTVFSSASRHFRSPNVDDLILAEEGLKPQSGETREIGFRFHPDATTYWSMTLFSMRIDDEIYFGPDPRFGGQSVNRNYVLPTRRTGAELQWRQTLNEQLRMNMSVGYVRPRFEGLDFDLPGVPRWTASASLEWAMTSTLKSVLGARYAGSTLDGNAADNPAFPSLPSYTVYDLGAYWQLGDVSLSMKVNNLFDKLYASRSFNGEIYPLPERHVTVSALWRF